MLNRFQGPEGNRLLVEALTRQKLIRGNQKLAETISTKVELIQIIKSDILIRQDAADNDLYFILVGKFSIFINGRPIAERVPGDHVGEMALLDASARRSATVIASENSVVGKISEQSFSKLGDEHPTLWKEVAIEIANRLRQRSRYIKEPNITPVVFIGSARESLPIAEQIKSGIQSPSIIAKLWTDGVFTASGLTLEDLETQLASSDFAILVASPDDRVYSRSVETDAPRDNVVFELGLFMGAIGRKRSFIVIPRGKDIKIPSDLLGMTPLHYDPASIPAIPSSSLCRDLVEVISRMGPR